MKFFTLERLGRERLSHSFFLREFLYSEISQIQGIPNFPHHPEIAINNGKRLCSDILEPLQSEFGRLFIRSGYRSPEINSIGAANRNQYNCSSNQRNFARHIWDFPDQSGLHGAMACVVVPAYLNYFEETNDWRKMADWICTNLDYSEVTFFPKLCAFNISWHQKPKLKITSYIKEKT